MEGSVKWDTVSIPYNCQNNKSRLWETEYIM